jgi:hypothetical protein
MVTESFSRFTLPVYRIEESAGEISAFVTDLGESLLIQEINRIRKRVA